jgi:DMSO reductase anchor subunit
LIVGLASSVLHLGRPLKAWRAFLGLRRSWLSREIVTFGTFMPFSALTTLTAWNPALGPLPTAEVIRFLTAVIGLLGVLCSAMIYHDTPRESWRGELSIGRFFSTTLMLGLAAAWCACEFGKVPTPLFPAFLVLVTTAKLSRELALARHCPDDPESSVHELPTSWARSAFLMRFRLGIFWRARIAAAVTGGIALPLIHLLMNPGSPSIAILGASCCLCGEWLERSLFFRTAIAPRMPGGVPS